MAASKGERASRAAGRRRLDRLVAATEDLAQIGSWELDLDARWLLWSDGMYRIHGLEPRSIEPTVELVVNSAHPEDRARVANFFQTVCERPGDVASDSYTGEYRIIRPDETVRHIRGRAQLVYEDGRALRWVGSAQDVTAWRLTERELQAHYALNRALRDWESFDGSLIRLLQRVGTALEFPSGALWAWDRELRRIVCRAFWTAPGVAVSDFESTTRAATFAPGQGVPGRVWQTGEPMVVGDLRDRLVPPRRSAAAEIGLRTGVAFPAVTEGHTLAVLSFYSFDPLGPSENLARTLAGIGAELGRFLAGRRAELEPGRLSRRELEVLRLAAEGRKRNDIAERLVVSPATVKTHFDHVFEKLGVNDRAAAVAQGFRLGLLR